MQPSVVSCHCSCRFEGDRDKDRALIAEMSKLIGNSSYGRMVTNKEKHHDIVYVNESEISTEIIDNHFNDMTELPDGCYEVEKTKKKINLDLPIHIGVFILNYAKLRMLEFYYDFWTIIYFVKTFRLWRWMLTATISGSLQKTWRT